MIHALLFVVLYVLFAGLLAISGIVEQISMDTGSGNGQNNSGLLLLYLMPLIFAVWGHEAATILIRKANKIAHKSERGGRALPVSDVDPCGTGTAVGDSSFNLHELIYHCMTALTARAQRKTLILSINIHSNVPVWVTGNESELCQVIRGLLNNAVKFTDSGEIALNAKTLEESRGKVLLRIEILDTGIGMSPETQTRIFDYDAPDGAEDDSLSVCKSLIETMGGKMGVNSERYHGSTFWFTTLLHKHSARGIAA